MLNQLEQYDTALIINKEAWENTSTNIESFYANAVEQYGRSLLGTGHLEEALSLVQKQICRMTSCSDTIDRITSYNVCYTKLLRVSLIVAILLSKIDWTMIKRKNPIPNSSAEMAYEK